jgi:hypothetical protein
MAAIVCRNVLTFDPDRLLGVGGPRSELWRAIDDVSHEVEPV